VTATHLEARSRWSLVAKCPRWAALGALGTPPADIDDATQRRFRRGKRLGQMIGQDFIDRYGADNVQLERPFAWPAGVGHGDIYVKPDRMAIEVKTSTSPDSMIDDALIQVAGAILYDGDVDLGGLYLIGPTLDEERLFPVRLTDELQQVVEERTLGVIRALQTKGDDLPPCVCANPGSCYGKGCQYTQVAWEGWERDVPPVELGGEVAVLAREVFELDQRCKAAKAAHSDVDGELREARAKLRPLLEPGVDYLADGLKLKITHVAPAPSIDVRTAIKAGAVDEELLERLVPFEKPRAAYDRWNLSQVAPAKNGKPTVAAESFGDEVPF
jgi:hypothetical protein